MYSQKKWGHVETFISTVTQVGHGLIHGHRVYKHAHAQHINHNSYLTVMSRAGWGFLFDLTDLARNSPNLLMFSGLQTLHRERRFAKAVPHM